LNPKQPFCRVIHPRTVLLEELCNLFKRNAFKEGILKEGIENELGVYLWQDGLGIEGSPNIGLTAGFVFQDQLFKDEHRQYLTKHRFFMLANCSETTQSLSLVNTLKAYLIAELISFPVRLDGKEFRFKIRFCLGDNAELEKELCKTAKKERCPNCNNHFEKSDPNDKIFRYMHLRDNSPNTWKTAIEIFLKSKNEGKTYFEACKEAELLGYIHGPPVFVVALRAHLIRLAKYESDEWFLKLLDEFLISPDILHNGMGLTKTMLSCFTKEWLDNDKFTERLRTLLRRNSISACKGSDLRYLVLNWESFINPSQLILTTEQQELMYNFFEYWSEIVWISYQNHKVQKLKCFQLHLKCRIYQLINIFQRFPPHWHLNNLYVHNVLAHYSNFFDKTDLILVSTEQGEQSFARWVRFSRTKKQSSNQISLQKFLV